ncbi:hypothetical protein BDQ17DRAFT_838113 [Cyathus striatus]|nr:hypothetical protein BDQ17DRAFT_838113 [Cyathus striatus]
MFRPQRTEIELEEYEYQYQYKDWTDVLTRNPILCTYIRNIRICLFNYNHQPEDAQDMEARLPWVLETLLGVYNLSIIPLTWNVGEKMNAALRQVFARSTLRALSVENALSISPWHLLTIMHVKHLSFDRVSREALPVFVRSMLPSDTRTPVPRVRLESLSITSCGSPVIRLLTNPVWDFTGLKHLKLGFGHPTETFVARTVSSVWDLVNQIAQGIEELTIVVYSWKNVYTPFDLSFFPKLRRLTFDVQFDVNNPSRDPLQTIIPLLRPQSSLYATLQTIRIVSPVLDKKGSMYSWFTSTDWRTLGTVLSENTAIYHSLQLLEIIFEQVFDRDLGHQQLDEVSNNMGTVEIELTTMAMRELHQANKLRVRLRIKA